MRKNPIPLFLMLILVSTLLFQVPSGFFGSALGETQLVYTTIEAQFFTASSDATWVEYDLFTDNNIPKGSVAEIIIRNANQVNERTGGVRKKGSSLERKINIHESEGGGYTTCSMLVKTDSIDGKIEVYTENIMDTDFVILGYFEGCDFTEVFDDLGWASSEWVEIDLSVYGVPSDAVVQIMCTTSSKNSRYFVGVRASGSTLERTILLDEAEGETTANNIISMIIKSDVNGIIERKAGVETLRGRHHLLGWFGSNVGFKEGFTQVIFSGDRIDGVWESRILIESPASSIATFAMVHQNAKSEMLCGLREEGSALNRYVEEHEAEGGGETGFMACVTLDTNSNFEIYCSDSSESMFFYMGYFYEIIEPTGGEEYERSVSQGIGIGLGTARIGEFPRSVSQTINIAANGGRLVELTRLASQTISITIQSVRAVAGNFVRAVSLPISISMNGTLGLIEVSRSVSQSITVGVQVMGHELGNHLRDVSLAVKFALEGGWPENPGNPSLFDDVFGGIPTRMNEIIVPLVFIVAILVGGKIFEQISKGDVPDVVDVLRDLSGPTWVLIAVVIMLLVLLAGISI